MKKFAPLLLVALFFCEVRATEYHVSQQGIDAQSGSEQLPLRTISAAAELAMPGDVIIVHEGVYRERIAPPRGGVSDTLRIIYRAAEGERVVIKGSERITSWEEFQEDIWKVTLPNTYFGDYNPYADVIYGDWFNDHGRTHHTGQVYLNGVALYESHRLEGVLNPGSLESWIDSGGPGKTWYCEHDDSHTYIYARFEGVNPNRELVEINVRASCFYPEEPGRNYITVSGFIFRHAATQWAPPTAEQIGLIGTHWSKGWIIENNEISDSRCVGITLGKERATGHNVWSNNRCKDGATHYNEVIFRALQIGWSKEMIGSHIIRNNTIYNCEQAGIVGSLGAVFSQIYNNHIYDIWTQRAFSGAEIAGIKIHASVDMLIKDNWIHDVGRGIWIDWMAQGTRITGNLLYRNSTDDLFTEVNHGPYLVDNNILLSEISIRDWSGGGAFVHNLIAGKISLYAELNRFTPYLFPHATMVAGLKNIQGGDNRFFNNMFTGGGLMVYNDAVLPMYAGGNLYYQQAEPMALEPAYMRVEDHDPGIALHEEGGSAFLTIITENTFKEIECVVVDSDLLGRTRVSDLAFENPDGTPLSINRDYFGQTRNGVHPTPGPFEELDTGKQRIRVR